MSVSALLAPALGKDAPAEIEEEEEGGEDEGDEYDDDGFEEYSDDSAERNSGRKTRQATRGAAASTAREKLGLGMIATAAGSNPESPLLSPAVNKRFETVPAPDDEVSSVETRGGAWFKRARTGFRRVRAYRIINVGKTVAERMEATMVIMHSLGDSWSRCFIIVRCGSMIR